VSRNLLRSAWLALGSRRRQLKVNCARLLFSLGKELLCVAADLHGRFGAHMPCNQNSDQAQRTTWRTDGQTETSALPQTYNHVNSTTKYKSETAHSQWRASRGDTGAGPPQIDRVPPASSAPEASYWSFRGYQLQVLQLIQDRQKAACRPWTSLASARRVALSLPATYVPIGVGSSVYSAAECMPSSTCSMCHTRSISSAGRRKDSRSPQSVPDTPTRRIRINPYPAARASNAGATARSSLLCGTRGHERT
jgi:hypothetical protein